MTRFFEPTLKRHRIVVRDRHKERWIHRYGPDLGNQACDSIGAMETNNPMCGTGWVRRTSRRQSSRGLTCLPEDDWCAVDLVLIPNYRVSLRLWPRPIDSRRLTVMYNIAAYAGYVCSFNWRRPVERGPAWAFTPRLTTTSVSSLLTARLPSHTSRLRLTSNVDHCPEGNEARLGLATCHDQGLLERRLLTCFDGIGT